MKKKLLTLILAVSMAISLGACGNDTKKKAEATRSETVSKNANMIDDASATFTGGTTGKWTTYTNGGAMSLKNIKDALAISVIATGSLDYSAQAYLDSFELKQGCKYRFAFDVSSEVPRTIQWRFQINGGDYHAYANENVKIDKNTKHVEKTFDMTETSDPAARICLNVGKFEGDGELDSHTITCDNFSLTLVDDSNEAKETADVDVPDINLDQVGFTPDMKKSATVRGKSCGGARFSVVDASSGKEVYSDVTSDATKNSASDETVAIASFTPLKACGTYKIKIDGIGESDEFRISSDVYDDLKKDVFRMLYMQRCGEELNSDYAGDFAHPACHTGKAIIYGTKKTKDVSGGWHDAGDYGRYVVSGAKAVEDLLLTYEVNPDTYSDDTGIPESGNGTPDILDEARYELDWLLKMQDDKSGGVYHKVTCKNFPGFVMPQDETDQLYLSPISTTATGDFAAVMAKASTVYSKIDPDFSKKALAASKKAMKFCLEKGDTATMFTNPSDISTGEYPDNFSSDEVFWGLSELYRATGDKTYLKEIKKTNAKDVRLGLGWTDVGTYGIYAYLKSDAAEDSYGKALLDKLNDEIDRVNNAEDNYGATCGDTYPWGSNLTMANNGMLFILADSLPDSWIRKTRGYDELADDQLHYILGQNANGYCFVTGYGTLSPVDTHHRPSIALGKEMPGMLAGGPDSNLEDPYAQATLKNVAPAKCYKDSNQAYSLNEVTIYWNSPLICLLSKY